MKVLDAQIEPVPHDDAMSNDETMDAYVALLQTALPHYSRYQFHEDAIQRHIPRYIHLRTALTYCAYARAVLLTWGNVQLVRATSIVASRMSRGSMLDRSNFLTSQ